MTEAIEQLIDQEPKGKHSAVYLYSGYIPTEHHPKHEIKKRVKSQILTTLRNHKRLANLSRLHEQVVAQALEKTDLLDHLDEGIAVFGVFNASELQKGHRQFSEKNVTIIPLLQAPVKESYVGRIFDLDQLIWLTFTDPKVLVATLERNGATLYRLTGTTLQKVGRVKNTYLDMKEKSNEYLEKYAPLREKSVIYSTGKENVSRLEEKENLNLLKDATTAIRTIFQASFRFERLLVYQTQSFRHLTDKLRIELATFLRASQFELITSNPPAKQFLYKEVKKILVEKRQNYLTEEYRQAKENFDVFAEGWPAVTQADREKRIAVLFVKPVTRQKGYLLQNELVYTYPIKGSRQIRNIAAWLVRSVVMNHGRVVVVDREGVMPGVEVAARLRY